MAHILFSDVFDVLWYMDYVLIASNIITIIYLLIKYYVLKKEITFRSLLKFFMFTVYICLLLQVAIFTREPGSRRELDLLPFSTWGNTNQSYAYQIENIFMFIPFGIFVPWITKFFSNWKRYLPILLLSSFLIEVIQYFTARGYTQTDDLIMNTLGGMIGYFFFCLLKILMKGYKKYHK